jgi:hypothetical protein
MILWELEAASTGRLYNSAAKYLYMVYFAIENNSIQVASVPECKNARDAIKDL